MLAVLIAFIYSVYIYRVRMAPVQQVQLLHIPQSSVSGIISVWKQLEKTAICHEAWSAEVHSAQKSPTLVNHYRPPNFIWLSD